MENIIEQVKELRTTANNLSIGHNMPISLAIERFRKAADTIETLSAKLAAANMERSDRYYNGGWITCEDRLPEESGYYDVTIESKINDETVRTTECRCFHKDIEFWAELIEPEFSIDETIIAWRNRPEPYRP